MSADVVDIAVARAERDTRRAIAYLIALGLLLGLAWAGRGE